MPSRWERLRVSLGAFMYFGERKQKKGGLGGMEVMNEWKDFSGFPSSPRGIRALCIEAVMVVYDH